MTGTDGPPVFAAVDVGASGGRVVAGVVDGGRVELHTVHRFANRAGEQDGHLRWDVTGLFEEVLTGLTALAERYAGVVSIGVDSWAVDYGLLDADGRLLAEPIAHRDDRTAGVIDAVHERVDPAHLYELTGVQHLPFNTIYQLAAEKAGTLWDRAAHVVLLPDLLGYWLTGALRTEVTNASTTGLLDVYRRTWSSEVLTALDLPAERFEPMIEPGDVLGPVLPALVDRLGLPASTVVTAVGSHDTASAVVGVPAAERPVAYISCGTWALVGLELDAPVVTPAARVANFTNEAGVDGRTRFLRNVGGLWLLQESLRTWAEAGSPAALDALLADAEALGDEGLRVDVDDPVFLPPGDMPSRIASAVGRSELLSPAATVRCVVDSLADAFADTLDRAQALAGVNVDVVHLVGGGSRNGLLCRLVADRLGRPVVAGPAEATALGNVLVQARAHGVLPASLDDLRATAAASVATQRYEPTVAGTRR